MFKAVIVEDDELIRQGLQLLIGRVSSGFEATALFSSAEEALTAFRSQPFDLLITDIEMPQINGLKLIELLRTEIPTQICFIITGYDRFEYAREGLRHGSLDYLLKPVDEDELGRVLGKAEVILQERRPTPEALEAMEQELIQCVYRSPAQLTSRIQALRLKWTEGRLTTPDLEHITQALRTLITDEEPSLVLGLWQELEELATLAAQLKGRSLPIQLAHDITQYIQEHFSEDMNVSTLASVFHVTPAYLGQVYLKVFHHSLTTAIHTCRIRFAKKLLTDSGLSINQISEQCGYKTVDHFYRQFRRLENKTPLAYRAEAHKHG